MNVKRGVVALAVVLFTTGGALAQTEWVDDPNNPVIEPGDAGYWDVRGPWARAVLFDGSMYHLYFTGSFGDQNPNDMAHATSSDGEEWTMDPANPVLTRGAPGEWDSSRLDGAAVIHDGTQYHMWYSAWGNDNLERVGYATSPDGTTWTKHPANPVMDVGASGSWDELIVRPTTVMIEDGVFRMWYGGGRWLGEFRWHVGYAESTDGVSWTKRADPVLSPNTFPGAWDSGEVANPYVVHDGSRYHMWYTGGFETLSSTDLSIGYAFSPDGIAWTKHRGNPVLTSDESVLFHSPVIHDGTRWHMWYTSWDGHYFWINHATSDCCPGDPGLTPQFIPAAAVASGAQGSFYQTDIDVSNAGDQEVEYQFLWLPRGEDNSEPVTSETFSLGAGMSVRYPNVLSVVFGLEPDSLGALALMSASPDLLAMSRTYNTPTGEPSGTYGQSMPAVTPDDLIRSGERRRILFGTENADMRTNVGCINGTGASSIVRYELFDMEGTSLGIETMLLPAWGNEQLNRVFEDYAPVSGYVEVWAPMTTGAFYCYGSVLDNMTSDPTTVLPQVPSDTTTFIPAAAVAEGAQGAFFRTDVDLNNSGPDPVEYQFAWLPRGRDNSDPLRSDSFSLAAGSAVRYANVLDEVFGLSPDEVGALSIEANGADLLAVSRTYNAPQAGGTFGQALPGVPKNQMIATGDTKRILFLSDDDEVRSNVGCVNGTGIEVAVAIDLHDSNGARLETKYMTLPSYSSRQINGIFQDYAPMNGYVDFRTYTPDALIYCYGSVLDNLTSDPTTVLPQ